VLKTKIDLAVIKEREGAESGIYPKEWPEVARQVKEANGWKCERCGHPNDWENGYTLTVHHLDMNKDNLEPWNLAALCLLPNTPILMADGSRRPIRDVKEGDMVIGADALPHRVLHQFRRLYRGKVVRVKAGGRPNRHIYMTPEHPVLTVSGKWVEAGNLSHDMELVTMHPSLGGGNAWNKGLTKQTDDRMARNAIATAASISDEEKLRRSRRMKRDNPMRRSDIKERVLVPLHESLRGKKIRYNTHELANQRILAEKASFEKQGYRFISIGHAKAIPDAIVIKDGKVFAVEVEYGTPDYDKYNAVGHAFDDIIWILRRPGKRKR